MRRNRIVVSSIISADVRRVAVRPGASGVTPGRDCKDDSVFAVVNAVRAGKSLKPKTWPNGARVAVWSDLHFPLPLNDYGYGHSVPVS